MRRPVGSGWQRQLGHRRATSGPDARYGGTAEKPQGGATGPVAAYLRGRTPSQADNETHSQYYYHSHRPEGGEHGHFHLFVRDDGIPKHIAPVPHEPEESWPTGDDIICHLGALAMEKRGYPIRLFTTNRWVTGENWYKAEDVIELLDLFLIDHAEQSWPTNRWVTAMAALFHPQICELLRERDRAVDAWREKHPDTDVYEDRDLELTSAIDIDVDKQIRQVEKALARF